MLKKIKKMRKGSRTPPEQQQPQADLGAQLKGQYLKSSRDRVLSGARKRSTSGGLRNSVISLPNTVSTKYDSLNSMEELLLTLWERRLIPGEAEKSQYDRLRLLKTPVVHAKL